MLILRAANRLLASSWQGQIKMELPKEIHDVVVQTMNLLSRDYPSLARINVIEGDAELMNHIGQLATKSATAVILNPHYWLDHGKIQKHSKDWHGAVVDSSVAGLIIHECGHILDGQALSKLGAKKYNALVDKVLRDRQGIWNDESPSAYGQENVFEFMAESFTAHYLGRPAIPNDLGRAALTLCNRLWDELNKILK